MAKQVIYRLVDDLSGEPIPEGTGESFSFSYQGSSYEIDLSDENASLFHETLAKYVSAGRKTTGRAKRPRSGPSSDKGELADVRSWAQDQGYKVNSRGRVAQSIIDAYDAAH